MAQEGSRPPTVIDIESLPDPHVILAAVRDDAGHIVDFAYTGINEAALADLGIPREKVLGSTLLELAPLTGDDVLLAPFIEVVDNDTVLVLDSFQYPDSSPNRALRSYDVSATKIGDGLGCSWWEVTQRDRSERELARAEARMRTTLDSLLDPHEMLTPIRDDTGQIVDLEYVHVNRASCRYLRKVRDELEGQRLSDIWSGTAKDFVIECARRVVETGEPLRIDEQEVVTPLGEVRVFDIRGVLVDDTLSFTYRDVTKRVSQAREVAHSREYYRLVAENASEMVFRSEADGTLSWVSPSVARTLGWTIDQIQGRSLRDLIHPDDLPDVTELQKSMVAAGELTGNAQCRMATADGGWRWMSVLGRAIVDENGQVIGGVDAIRDIQSEHDALVALAESEERFRRSMMDAAIGMAIVGMDGRFVSVNPALCALLARDERTLMSTTWQELTHPDDLATDAALVADVLAGRRDTYRLAKRYLHPDGTVVWADLTVSGVRSKGGQLGHLMAQVVDITESVRAREALARSEEHFRLLAENSSDVVFRASREAVLEWVSPSVDDVLGFAPGDLLGALVLDFVEPEDLPPDLHLDPRSADTIDFVGRVRTASGSSLWMDIAVRPVVGENGSVIGRVGRLRDVQAEHDAQEALRRSEQLFRTAMESAPTGMAVVGLDREFLQVNPALCRLLGRTEDWLLGRSVSDVLDPLDDDLDRRLRSQVLAGLVTSMTRDHQMIRSDGERVLVEQSIGLLRDEQGQATAYVSQFADVTEARATREQLRFLATHDSLTELLNRRELVTRISGVLAQTPRTGIHVGVLFIDLDGLKSVNDTYGHAVGDEVIVTVARRIRDRVRGNDVLARFGGDEFVLVLPAIHTVDDVLRICVELHRSVEQPMVIGELAIVMTMSVGVVVVSPGEDPDTALREADAALYRAKREGRARTVVYDPQLDGSGPA